MFHVARNRLKLLSSSLLSALLLASPLAMALEVGDKAPDFSLQSSDGKTYTLSQFLGEKPVVIAFFPKAFTGG
ncbi:MAG: redoxin domain-containing protein [Pseudomonadales bacterium]|nr:redoxin domain-containing protein [Pseudomonadales bacterium]